MAQRGRPELAAREAGRTSLSARFSASRQRERFSTVFDEERAAAEVEAVVSETYSVTWYGRPALVFNNCLDKINDFNAIERVPVGVLHTLLVGRTKVFAQGGRRNSEIMDDENTYQEPVVNWSCGADRTSRSRNHQLDPKSP